MGRILAFDRAAPPNAKKLWTFAKGAAELKILTRGLVGLLPHIRMHPQSRLHLNLFQRGKEPFESGLIFVGDVE